jgi:hypothetical protein
MRSSVQCLRDEESLPRWRSRLSALDTAAIDACGLTVNQICMVLPRTPISVSLWVGTQTT